MSEEKTTGPLIEGDAVLVLVVVLLIVLCAGEPDLLDAIVYRVSDGKVVPKSMQVEDVK